MNAIDILNKIEQNGFEAYIVGGYVRDYLLGIESNDIDICTNARVKELLDIFADTNATSNEYGSVKIITNSANIDITTYRRDVAYNGSRRQVEIEYVDNLIDDIERRDFTINAICLSKEKSIIDLVNGQEDIKNKIIRCVGNPEQRIKEDPLRMLRAVRFATILNFKIEEELYKILKMNRSLIEQLSLTRIKEELTKILVNKNALKGLEYLRNLGFLKHMKIEYNNNIIYVNDICGMYSQLTFTEDYPFSKEEQDNINNIKEIVNSGIITSNTLFNYGLYTSLVASDLLKINRDEVIKIDKELAIHKLKDIDITSEEICSILHIEPSKTISIVYDKLKDLIINKELDNKNDIIKEYIINNREMWLNDND